VALALANCVAKGYDSPEHHRTRYVLESAGVTVWEAFLREFVAPIKTYPVPMAMFSAHTDYRWVTTAKLPVPHNPHRLPPELMKDWCSLGADGGCVEQREDLDRWIERQRGRTNLAEVWPLMGTDWA
jgi:hypothetical protein